MSKYTRSQLHERITDLSGQYRAAQENKRLTSAKRAEEDRLADQARQADEKADEHIERVRQLIAEAKAEYASAVDEMLDGPAPEERFEAEKMQAEADVSDALAAAEGWSERAVLEGGPCDVVISEPFADFGHPAQNGLDTTAIDEAYDRAVNP